MKNRRVEWGFFIITIGIVLLLINYGIVNWSVVNTLMEFWPVIFIIIGINIIFRRNSIVRIAVWVVFLAALIGYSYYYGDARSYRSDWKSTVPIEKKVETENADLHISLGGTRLDLGSTNQQLVDVSLTDPDIVQSVEYSSDNKNAAIRFKKDRIGIFTINSRDSARFNLNENVAWKLDVDTGVVTGSLDMSNLKMESVDLDCGAANLKLVLGDKCNSTDVKIDAGASSIEVAVPENAGVRVRMDGGLSNSNLRSLGWNKEGKYYVSPNYESAASKIDVDIDMGVGNFKVTVLK